MPSRSAAFRSDPRDVAPRSPARLMTSMNRRTRCLSSRSTTSPTCGERLVDVGSSTLARRPCSRPRRSTSSCAARWPASSGPLPVPSMSVSRENATARGRPSAIPTLTHSSNGAAPPVPRSSSAYRAREQPTRAAIWDCVRRRRRRASTAARPRFAAIPLASLRPAAAAAVALTLRMMMGSSNPGLHYGLRPDSWPASRRGAGRSCPRSVAKLLANGTARPVSAYGLCSRHFAGGSSTRPDRAG
jgi:hypothetical protein